MAPYSCFRAEMSSDEVNRKNRKFTLSKEEPLKVKASAAWT